MSTEELTDAVAYLDEASVRHLLVEAARSNPSVAELDSKVVFIRELKESQEEIEFCIFTSRAEKSINRGLQLRPSKQFEMAYGVVSDVEGAISSIKGKVAAHSSFASKLGAMTALCKIGELVIDCSEEIGKTLKMSLSAETKLEDSMEAVLGCMTEAEKASLRTQKGSELGESLEALIAGEDGYDMFSRLKSIHREYFAETVASSR